MIIKRVQLVLNICRSKLIIQGRNQKAYHGGAKYFRGVNIRLGRGQKYTKYNRINNNSENFKGERLLLGRGFATLSYGPGII